MNKTLVFASLILCSLGCDQAGKTAGTSGGSYATGSHTNTAINVRDRDPATKTPIDQNENKTDLDLTAEIRSRVVATQMSIDAQNIKIITQEGRVTLRGPVKTADEKSRIAAIAREVAGAANVDDQIEVEVAR